MISDMDETDTDDTMMAKGRARALVSMINAIEE